MDFCTELRSSIPIRDLWGIEFPPVAESAEAVARMLLECSYCKSREVVYLNELELRGFESNRGIARRCKTCSVPSIWTQAPHEDEKKIAARMVRGRRGARNGAEQIPESGDQRERERIRFKTRLTSCIRQAGADDELAVCEDISPIGMCFRSKRRYEGDTAIDVAVPYAPDSANIFMPAKVVYSEAMPKAGLFRHGVEYRRIGLAPKSNCEEPKRRGESEYTRSRVDSNDLTNEFLLRLLTCLARLSQGT